MNRLTIPEALDQGIKQVEIIAAPSLSDVQVRCTKTGRQFTLTPSRVLDMELTRYARANEIYWSVDLVGTRLELRPLTCNPANRAPSRTHPARWYAVAKEVA